MTRPNAWLRLAAISCVAVVGCLGASACGDDDTSSDAKTRTAITANQNTATAQTSRAERREAARHARKLAAEHGQSREERSIGHRAKQLQVDLMAGDYAAVCDQLLASTASALATSSGTCAKGLSEAKEANGPIPLIAWVRLRGDWGNVMVLKDDGNLDLSSIIRKGSRWRFVSLSFLGID